MAPAEKPLLHALRADPANQKEKIMATDDKCCSIVPYFKVSKENQASFKALCEKFVEKTCSEPQCHYYGFSFSGELAHCREAYADAQGLLDHLQNVGSLLQEALKIAELVRLEVHGPEAELAKLREPLAGLNPQFFTLEYGFRK
jgi:quinol monooxygenase YgiN